MDAVVDSALYVYACCLSSVFLIAYSSSAFFFFKQKTAYELRISDWSSDVCSSDLLSNENEGAAKKFGQDLMNAVKEGAQFDLFQSGVESMIQRAQEIDRKSVV